METGIGIGTADRAGGRLGGGGGGGGGGEGGVHGGCPRDGLGLDLDFCVMVFCIYNICMYYTSSCIYTHVCMYYIIYWSTLRS